MDSGFIRLAALILTTSLFANCSLWRLEFDSAKWKTTSEMQKGRMVDDLSRRKLVVGKTKAEIIDLLGAPDKSEPDWFKYYAGVNSGFLDRQFILVSFDPSSDKATFLTEADD